MPLSTTELNRLADDIVNANLTCRVHSADPGANGTANRIGTAEGTLTAASWSGAASGDVAYNAQLDVGALDPNAEQTVRFISLWRGNVFVADAAMAADVVVAQGGTFQVNTGTIRFNGSTS